MSNKMGCCRMAASTAESVPAKQQIMRSVEGPPFATPYFGIWILCRGQLFVIIIVAQAVGPAFLPLSLAAFAYEYTFLGYQPAAQIHLLRTALNLESFKWLIINPMKLSLLVMTPFQSGSKMTMSASAPPAARLCREAPPPWRDWLQIIPRISAV